MKYTQWFSSEEHAPIHFGIYQTTASMDSRDRIYYRRYGLKGWCKTCFTLKDAEDTEIDISFTCPSFWRGIKK